MEFYEEKSLKLYVLLKILSTIGAVTYKLKYRIFQLKAKALLYMFIKEILMKSLKSRATKNDFYRSNNL